MDGKVDTGDALIARLAEAQHGVVSVAQMRNLGVSDDAVRARMFAGRLHRVHRGVYAVGHGALSIEGRCLAAVLAVGRGSARSGPVLDCWGAATSHRSAAILWGLLPAVADLSHPSGFKSGPVSVVVPGTAGRARHRGIQIHRSRSLVAAQVTLRHAVPVTTPARTIADMRLAISIGKPSISERELRKAIRQANVIGLPVADEDAGDRTRSDLEAAFLAICSRHRMPRPEVNVRIGPFLVDFLWREERLVVETDSYLYHRGKIAFQDDRRRELELMRLGYDVLRLSEQQVDEEPDRVAATLQVKLGGSGTPPLRSTMSR
jgi:very-short-patch-repair endonuclease